MATYISASRRYVASVRYADPVTGAARRKPFYGKAPEEADAAADAFRATPLSERPTESAPRTVRELFRAWLAEKKPGVDRASSTWTFSETPVQQEQWDDYESTVRVHILPQLGTIELTALGRDTLRRFFEKVAVTPSRRGGEPISVSTQRKIHSRLTSALTYAELRRWLAGNPDGNPIRGVPTPTELPGTEGRAVELSPTERALNVAETRAFQQWIAATFPTHLAYRVRWAIAFELGLRQAEVLGLTWDAIGLSSRKITVRQQLRRRKHAHGCVGAWVDALTSPCTVVARRAAGDPKLEAIPAARCPDRVPGVWSIVGTTKSKKVRRVLASQALADELALLYEEQHPADAPALAKADASRLAKVRAKARYPVADADLVIRAVRGGGHVSRTADNRLWHRACEAAGISPVGRDVHAARHTAATRMVEAGVALTTVKEVLGHSTIAVTMRYVTTTAGAQDVALDLVAEYIAKHGG